MVVVAGGLALHAHRASGITLTLLQAVTRRAVTPTKPLQRHIPTSLGSGASVPGSDLVPNRRNTPIICKLSTTTSLPCARQGDATGTTMFPTNPRWVTEAPCNGENGPKCVAAGQGRQAGRCGLHPGVLGP